MDGFLRVRFRFVYTYIHKYIHTYVLAQVHRLRHARTAVHALGIAVLFVVDPGVSTEHHEAERDHEARRDHDAEGDHEARRDHEAEVWLMPCGWQTQSP